MILMNQISMMEMSLFNLPTNSKKKKKNKVRVSLEELMLQMITEINSKVWLKWEQSIKV